MNKKNLVGLVLAGGYGFLTEGRAKLVESLIKGGNLPLVRPVVELVTRLCDFTGVVVNPTYFSQVEEAISGIERVQYVMQLDRTGTAGAVWESLWQLNLTTGVGPDHALILYGDMPFWTENSISSLIAAHKSTSAVISMFSVSLGTNGLACPEMVKNFGRILLDKDGGIIGIKEPYEMSDEDLAKATHVNPSAWVLDLRWFNEQKHNLAPHNKLDGYRAEYWLPDLVRIAYQNGDTITMLPLHNREEAIGINTMAELEEAQRLYSRLLSISKGSH